MRRGEVMSKNSRVEIIERILKENDVYSLEIDKVARNIIANKILDALDEFAEQVELEKRERMIINVLKND